MTVCILQMLYFDRIDVSERNYVNKTSASKESDICHYYYYSSNRSKLQPNVCNKCHYLLMMSVTI